MKNICVSGVGYVGLVTGTCFADLGNRVTCVDIVEERIANLNKGILPIYEPGLEEMVKRNVGAGRLFFTTDYAQGLKDAEFVFIAVGTPEGVDGEADLQYVRQASVSIAQAMAGPLIIVNKSTVPVGTGDWVADIVRQNQPTPIPFSVVSCPEFLREGSAIADFMSPHRTVLGSLDRDAANRVADLHLPLRAPIVVTDLRTAEMIKYASNAFLATKISFINEIANICEALGADVKEVAAGMGYDPRIGRQFFDAGIGYGGSCFEGHETVFVQNSPSVRTETLRSLFADAGEPVQGDRVQVVVPPGRRVLAFDLQAGQPALADVKAVTRRSYSGTMARLTTTMGRSLAVTADHPVILRAGAGFKILPAGLVAPGDQLLALCELPPVEPASDLNLIDLLTGSEVEADTFVAPTDGSFADQVSRLAAQIPPGLAHEIRRHNRIPLRPFQQLRASGVLSVPAEKLQLYTAGEAAGRINATIPVDADLLRLCGYYLAAGTMSRDAGRAGEARARVGFRFRDAGGGAMADVQRILRRWGLTFIERRGGGAASAIVSSRIFAHLLREVLMCGTRPTDKTLPRLAFNVPAELRCELVRGALSGRGATTVARGGGTPALEYATASRSLADGMALLLQTLGILPSIRTRRANRSGPPAYILRVGGHGPLSALRDVLGERHRARVDTLLAGRRRHIRGRGFVRHGPVAALTVLDVATEEVSTEVYSLETSTGTLVASSGLICHNCFPKDVKALAYMASVQGKHPQLLQAVMEINTDQRRLIVNRLRDLLGTLEGQVVGLLGLAFKPNTDDMREAPSIDIAQALLMAGAKVKGYDPVAMASASRVLPNVQLAQDPYDLAVGCDALVVVTEWNEFKQLDLQRIKESMRGNVVVDGRNIYEPGTMAALGYVYRGVGRGYNDS